MMGDIRDWYGPSGAGLRVTYFLILFFTSSPFGVKAPYTLPERGIQIEFIGTACEKKNKML